jgi:DDE family transposase
VDVEALPLHGQGGLFEILCAVPDPRKRRGVRHKIPSILATALCAVLAGARNLTAMAEWAAEQSPETLRRLGSTRGKPPSERTYRRTFDAIDVEEIDRRTGTWMAEQQRGLAATALALDGKTVRGSGDGETAARHLLSAIVHDSGVVVAQRAVGAKTNEITQVEALLEGLNIQGAVITADALLTQRKIADYLVEKKNADYVFTVKDNQLTLRQDIATLGLDASPPAARNGR